CSLTRSARPSAHTAFSAFQALACCSAGCCWFASSARRRDQGRACASARGDRHGRDVGACHRGVCHALSDAAGRRLARVAATARRGGEPAGGFDAGPGPEARGRARALPLLTVSDDARPRLPAFGPPAIVQRTMGGVRDASRIELASPGGFMPTEVPVRARLDVIVFNRAVRAAAWSDLMG